MIQLTLRHSCTSPDRVFTPPKDFVAVGQLPSGATMFDRNRFAFGSSQSILTNSRARRDVADVQSPILRSTSPPPPAESDRGAGPLPPPWVPCGLAPPGLAALP